MPAADPPSAASAWLDLGRFASRRWLDGTRRQHPTAHADGGRGDLVAQVRSRWAARLGVASTDLLVCPTDVDAYRLVLGALLAPTDVVLVAEPAPPAALTAILGLGGRYLDVGRRADGRIAGGAVDRALLAWPEAVAVVEAPSLFGTDDRQWVADPPQPAAAPAGGVASAPRALVVDARHAPGWAMLPTPAESASMPLATLIALRDPDAPADPVAIGIVCAPGTGAGLLLLQGQPQWPEASLQHALAVLRGLAVAGFTAAADAELAALRARCVATVRAPGVVALPHGGWRQAFECLGGDAAGVAAALRGRLPALLALPAHPGRALLVADLGRLAV